MPWLETVQRRFGIEHLQAGVYFFVCVFLVLLVMLLLAAIRTIDSIDFKAGNWKRIASSILWAHACLLSRGFIGLLLAIVGSILYLAIRNALGYGVHALAGCVVGILAVRLTLVPKYLPLAQLDEARRLLAALRWAPKGLEEDLATEAESLTRGKFVRTQKSKNPIDYTPTPGPKS